jgi:putative phosphotransacetylase
MDKEKLVQIVAHIVREKLAENKELYVPIGVSARHLHLTKEHLEILFGKGYELKKKKELMGGQYAAEECVTILGSKLSSIEKVRILGPLRSKTQVELSKTDAIKLGINAPARESGSIKGSAPITIVGPKGAVALEEGCIIAKRHIHMSPQDAKNFGVQDNQKVSVRVKGDRGGIFENVQVRVDETYTLEMHIDTDEANAFEVKCGSVGELTINN